MYRYNNISELAWNDHIRQWMDQVDNMTGQNPKVLVLHKFLEIINQITYYRIKIDALNNSLMIFADKTVIFELQYKNVSKLNLTIDESNSKILSIMKDMIILKNDIIVVNNEIEAATIKFEHLNRSHDNIVSFIKNDIEKINSKYFLCKIRNRNNTDIIDD